MEVFFALVIVVGKLIWEHIQERRAEEYARRVVRRYDGKRDLGIWDDSHAGERGKREAVAADVPGTGKSGPV